MAPVREIGRYPISSTTRWAGKISVLSRWASRRYACLVVLGYSRLLWVQFVVRQTMTTVMDSLEAASQYVGGGPRRSCSIRCGPC